MTSPLVAGVLAVILVLPLTGDAQEPSPRQRTSTLELTRAREAPQRPIARPELPRDQAAAEADRAAAEYERMKRGEALMRELSRPGARRPDLGYDVSSGIQQRNIQRTPLR